MPCRVLIVDDQIVARQFFQSIIASCERYEIVDMIDAAGIDRLVGISELSLKE